MKKKDSNLMRESVGSFLSRYIPDDLIDLIESAWEHIDELKRRLIVVLIFVFSLTLFFLMIGFHPVSVDGLTVHVPDLDYTQSFSAKTLQMIEHDLVPADVRIITLSPTDAVVNQMKIALILALIVGMPLIVYEIAMFVGPGLLAREKRIMTITIVPASILFFIGAVVGYLFVATWAYDFLFSFAGVIVDEKLFHINSLVSFSLIFVIAMGLAFEMPVIMVGLSRAGVIDKSFWKKNWRYAAVGIFIFGAVITPDASGITMLMVSLPMLVLYLIGYLLSGKRRISLPQSNQ